MENFTIERRYVKLCNGFRAVISCMKAAFYRTDYQNVSVDQKTRPNSCFKTSDRAFKDLRES